MFSKKFLISVLALGYCAIPASASLTTYTSISAFTTATASDTFQNIIVTPGSLGTSYSDQGVTFTDALGLFGASSPGGWPGGEVMTSANTGPSTINIALPASINAIEFYVGTQNFSDFEIQMTDTAGGTFTDGIEIQPTGTTPLYFGITTTASFSSFSVIAFNPPDKITLEDISVGSPDVAETPEVATLLLVATGLFLMGYFRRWTSRTHAARRGTVRTMSTGITPA
jgi:hypothetical protein